MTAPTALIAEDEPLLAAGLRADLAALWPELVVVAQVGDGASAVAQALALQPQVCFLDIRMPGLSGLEAAQMLAEEWPEHTLFPLLVFVTAYDQYALAAFDAQAVDYLVKPVDRTRLQACVYRLKARLYGRLHASPAERSAQTASAADDTLAQTMTQLRALLGAAAGGCAGTGGTGGNAGGAQRPPLLDVVQAQIGNLVHLVPVAEVIYFEAADKYVRVVTAEREHLIRMSLRELLPQLDAQRFWQVHRSTVVQARCISTARREESGKVTLTLAGHRDKLTASRLYAHLFKGM